MKDDKRIEKILENNWIGKTVKIDDRKYEVIDHNGNKIQVIEFEKSTAKWVSKCEVEK